MHGFPNRVNFWGHHLVKMTKNCIKITKSTVWGQNRGGGHEGTSQLFGTEDHPSPPLLGKNLLKSSILYFWLITFNLKRFDAILIFKLAIFISLKTLSRLRESSCSWKEKATAIACLFLSILVVKVNAHACSSSI